MEPIQPGILTRAWNITKNIADIAENSVAFVGNKIINIFDPPKNYYDDYDGAVCNKVAMKADWNEIKNGGVFNDEWKNNEFYCLSHRSAAN